MTKLPSILLATCVLLWIVAKHCDCADPTPQETYKKWKSLKTSLEAVGQKEDCTATPEQMLSWIYLKKLFNDKKGYGIMRFAWPRLTFYSTQLAPLTDSPASDLNICNFEKQGGYTAVCFENKCTSCEDFYESDEEPAKKTPDDITSSICFDDYAKPEDQKVDKEREKELKRLWKPPVTSPGPLSPDEVNSWIELKMKNKKNVAEKEGDDCDAPPELSLSLSYLQNQFDYMAENEVRRELEDFPNFYAEKLRWLKGADKEIISCGRYLVCGWDAVCVYCEINSFEEKELQEACGPKTHGIYKNPREAYKMWVYHFQDLKRRSVDRKKQDATCDTNQLKTMAWFYLMELFHLNQKEGVMKYAWPRLSFYENKLHGLNSGGGVVCEWDLNNKGEILLCDDGKCKQCGELDLAGKYNNDDSFYKKLCGDTHEKAKDADVNEEEVKKWKDLVVPVEDPKGVLTLEEALSWNVTLGNTSVKGQEGDCDAHPKLTLSQKTLTLGVMRVKEEGGKEKWRWRTEDQVKAEMQRNQKTYDNKLKWLKAAEKTREFCRDEFVCAFDGVCIPCGVVTDGVEELKEACEVKVQVESGGVARGERKWGALVTFGAVLGLLQL